MFLSKCRFDQKCKILVIVCCVLIIHFSIIYFRASERADSSDSSSDRMKLIIDTDAGGDDAVAIFLALAARELDVIAITCAYGNTDEDNVEINVLKIRTVADRPDIPVYGGAKKPLIQNYTASDYFGKDGFGDFAFDREIVGNIDRSKHASIAMVDLVNKYPGEVSIVTLGPLTNVALAASLDSNFTRNVKRFYVMGSRIARSIDDASLTEFNFGLDPDSNEIFLNSPVKFKSLITPWEVVHHNIITTEWRTQILGVLNSEVIKFLNKVEGIVLERLTEWLPADSITVATMIWPELIKDTFEARMSSVPCNTNGSVIVDVKSYDDEKNVEIIKAFDVVGFKDKLLKYLA